MKISVAQISGIKVSTANCHFFMLHCVSLFNLCNSVIRKKKLEAKVKKLEGGLQRCYLARGASAHRACPWDLCEVVEAGRVVKWLCSRWHFPGGLQSGSVRRAAASSFLSK